MVPLGSTDIDLNPLVGQLQTVVKNTDEIVKTWPVMAQRACNKMLPKIRVWLGIQYKRSGVGKVSGQLWACCVERATVRYIDKGNGSGVIRIVAGEGFPLDVYKRLNVFVHGGVWNNNFSKATYTDLPTGQQRSYKQGLQTNKHGMGGDYGRRLKRSIKRSVLRKIPLSQHQTAAKDALKKGDFHVRPPKPHIFRLDPYYQQIGTLFSQYMQEQVEKRMRRAA